MNYLAHSFLSFGKPDIIVGNFIADAVHGKNFDAYPESIAKGILLHRKIDSYTDQHPVYLTSKHRFRKDFDKYSGVLMDIFYDHFLAKNFTLYADQSLQQYANGIYRILDENQAHMPPHSQRFFQYMTQHNVLVQYSKIEGIETVLSHLSHRIRNRYELQTSVPQLVKEYSEIEEEFLVFFKELRAFCSSQPEINA